VNSTGVRWMVPSAARVKYVPVCFFINVASSRNG
jgi:hypothetical protein